MTLKTLSSEEARTNLRDVLDEVMAGESEVVIERHGKPTVAVISYKEFQRIQKERERRRARLARIKSEMDSGNYFTWDQVEASLKEKGLL
ncbi:MAG: type II toxin-antitoxin system Phd/YefM family antitoxin [Caldilineaceae bacterium]